jgi:hypothetical protein
MQDPPAVSWHVLCAVLHDQLLQHEQLYTAQHSTAQHGELNTLAGNHSQLPCWGSMFAVLNYTYACSRCLCQSEQQAAAGALRLCQQSVQSLPCARSNDGGGGVACV